MIDFQFYIKKYAYLIGIVVFAIWMLFFDSNSWLSHRKLNKEIEVLKRQKEFLQKEIVKDRDIIREINTPKVGKNLVEKIIISKRKMRISLLLNMIQ